MKTTHMLAMLLTVAAMFALADTSALAKDPADVQKAAAAEKLEPYTCGHVQRLHTLGGIFLASQPDPDDFRTAQEGGIKTVVNLRLPDELNWDEPSHVRKLGMEYVAIPFRSPDSLTDEVFAKSLKVLSDETKRPLILHCASANRVGAIWLAHRVLDDGIAYSDALAEAKTVGLKLPAYETKAADYIRRMKKQ
ncbi:MAG: hypothetical protein KDA42_17570 [Planctomycetales bacterium]|nr:hypothetical protein [Planctomycetales bacterium]